jgi:hypothetical protein
MSQSTTEGEKSPAATPHDFDFLFGTWRIHNRRLDDPFGDSESWSEFEAQSEAYPILGRLGNVQHFDAPHFPGRPASRGTPFGCSTPRKRSGVSGGPRRPAAAASTHPFSAAFATESVSSTARTSSTDARSVSGFFGQRSRRRRLIGSSRSPSTAARRSSRTGSCSTSAPAAAGERRRSLTRLSPGHCPQFLGRQVLP